MLYSCPRDQRLLISWRSNSWTPCNPSDYHSTIVLRGLRGSNNWTPIVPRDISLSGSGCNCFPVSSAGCKLREPALQIEPIEGLSLNLSVPCWRDVWGVSWGPIITWKKKEVLIGRNLSIIFESVCIRIQKWSIKYLSLDVRFNIWLRMFSVLFICHRYSYFLCLERLSYRVKEVKSIKSI